MKRLILIVLFFISLISCGQEKPKSLNECIAYFENNWSKKELEDFKNKQEKEAVTELHFSVGLWIRNNWIRKGNESLLNQFSEIGINHPDDISSIILTSFHRKLNNRNIDLINQTKPYIDYWKEINERKTKSQQKAIQIYNKHKIGDTITLLYPVDIADNSANAFIYENNENWEFNPNKDLKLTGVIEKKFFINSKNNVFFNLKIIEMNFPKTTVLMQEMEIGKTYDFNLNNLRVE